MPAFIAIMLLVVLAFTPPGCRPEERPPAPELRVCFFYNEISDSGHAAVSVSGGPLDSLHALHGYVKTTTVTRERNGHEYKGLALVKTAQGKEHIILEASNRVENDDGKNLDIRFSTDLASRVEVRGLKEGSMLDVATGAVYDIAGVVLQPGEYHLKVIPSHGDRAD
jgi:hypothetical protein